MLLLALVYWQPKPQEVIPVDLVEALPAAVERQPAGAAVPVAANRPQPQPVSATQSALRPAAVRQAAPVQRPSPPRPAVQPVASAMDRPAAGAATSLPSAEGGGAAAAPGAALAAPEAVETRAPAVRPAETVEQRYFREQFAYIRERVMARLVYPPLARRQGWCGRVRVEFIVLADGSVDDLRVIDSSGRTLLDRQAIHAVLAAAPFPAPPVPARISLPVTFTLAASR